MDFGAAAFETMALVGKDVQATVVFALEFRSNMADTNISATHNLGFDDNHFFRELKITPEILYWI